MTTPYRRRSWLLLAVIIFLASCRKEDQTPVPVADEPTEYPAQVTNYSLGETAILQDHFPEDSRFRDMPVRLEGVVGAPASQGPFPVVLIMHGSHLICPGEDAWPCPAEVEQANYAGFSYLVEALAEAGYVALSINVNAEHTFAFGEAPPGVRTKQLIDLHLGELAAANEGASGKFGLDLTGRVDLSRMAWIGHSRGGDFANRLIREGSLQDEAGATGYGPVQGLILLAPPVMTTDVLPAVDVATALVLPACDWDVSALSGQLLYESARFDPERQNAFTSVYLEHANHANFNSVLEPDPILDNRPDCTAEQALASEGQQAFLAQYVTDFLHSVYAPSGETGQYRQRLGLEPAHPLPTELFDIPVQVTTLLPADQRATIIQPVDEAELTGNLFGGQVLLMETTAVFCPDGYFVPAEAPDKDACQRVNFNQPGYPQQLVLAWDSGDAAWRTTLPESAADLGGYAALQVRAALDPLSERNSAGEPLSFSIELVDGDGGRAEASELELVYPPGVRQPNEIFEGDWFTGHVNLQTFHVRLRELTDVDISNITEIALLFDQTSSGSLFIADLELIKSGR